MLASKFELTLEPTRVHPCCVSPGVSWRINEQAESDESEVVEVGDAVFLTTILYACAYLSPVPRVERVLCSRLDSGALALAGAVAVEHCMSTGAVRNTA